MKIWDGYMARNGSSTSRLENKIQDTSLRLLLALQAKPPLTTDTLFQGVGYTYNLHNNNHMSACSSRSNYTNTVQGFLRQQVGAPPLASSFSAVLYFNSSLLLLGNRGYILPRHKRAHLRWG